MLEKAGKVICVELDSKMLKILEDRFKLYNNFELLHQDILKVDLKEIIKNEKKNPEIKNVKIVANLPYYITTPIIMKLLEEKLDLSTITVMVQKEVGDRLIATPGKKDTGAITYTVYYYAEAEGILNVPKESFIPAPEVTSEVIKFTIRKEAPVNVVDKNIMFKIIKSAFSSTNALAASFDSKGLFYRFKFLIISFSATFTGLSSGRDAVGRPSQSYS